MSRKRIEAHGALPEKGGSRWPQKIVRAQRTTSGVCDDEKGLWCLNTSQPEGKQKKMQNLQAERPRN